MGRPRRSGRDARCRGRAAGLRLAKGALVLKSERGDAAAQVRIAHAGAFNPDGGLVLRLAFGLELPLALARVRDLLLALDGKLAGKTRRLMAIDLYGACLVLWGCAGGLQSYLPLRADAVIGFVLLRVNYPDRCRLHSRLKVQRTLPTMWASWARHV